MENDQDFFLKRGQYLKSLDEERQWDFTPCVDRGAIVKAGQYLGSVPEGLFRHHIMVPLKLQGTWEVTEIMPPGLYRVSETIAILKNTAEQGQEVTVTMKQEWPVKMPVRTYEERLLPNRQLLTQCRLIDIFFPLAEGGTACIPGPFGAGKTVLQQIISRYAEADVVIIVACGERAGEVVETIREFPELEDPKTGESLMNRTVIICNTSSMPVAAREASIYTGITIGEYYRQLGLKVLLLADSTSRWAQALRESSARLEEIPGEEAFPAYLESRIAAVYERAGLVRLHDGEHGLADRDRQCLPGRRKFRRARDPEHAEGRGRLLRPLPIPFRPAALPGHRSAHLLEPLPAADEGVPGGAPRRMGGTGRGGPPAPLRGQRNPPDDARRRRGGDQSWTTSSPI